MKTFLNILVIGDDDVGKSSLISYCISRKFPQEVPMVLSDSMLPPNSIFQHIPVTIIDSSARLHDREVLKQKIAISDSIVLMFDVTRLETLDNLGTVWIPLINEIRPDLVPLILVASKTDLIETDEFPFQEQNQFLENNPAIRCIFKSSALDQNYPLEVFTAAMKIVLYPTEKIFDYSEKEFTPIAYKAYKRIFRILDQDGNNLLDTNELANYYFTVFGEIFRDSDWEPIKEILVNPEEISNNCVTFPGFLSLIKNDLFMEDQNITPWIILKAFHYDDDLNLIIPEQISSSVKVEDSYELSSSAERFLESLARNAYYENTRPIKSAGDSDSNSELEDCLTSEALHSIFSSVPPDVCHPWQSPPSFKVTKGVAVLFFSFSFIFSSVLIFFLSFFPFHSFIICSRFGRFLLIFLIQSSNARFFIVLLMKTQHFLLILGESNGISSLSVNQFLCRLVFFELFSFDVL
jgi:small GTP-binding protein